MQHLAVCLRVTSCLWTKKLCLLLPLFLVFLWLTCVHCHRITPCLLVLWVLDDLLILHPHSCFVTKDGPSNLELVSSPLYLTFPYFFLHHILYKVLGESPCKHFCIGVIRWVVVGCLGEIVLLRDEFWQWSWVWLWGLDKCWGWW